jgi:predicted enzyme related to lactoylglutathione lyase
MGQPVAMFEVVSTDPSRVRDFYTKLFDWSDLSSTATR